MGTESPSKLEVKKEKPEQKEVANQPADLSTKEKAAALNEKEKTEQRINQLGNKLIKCLELIRKLPAGKIKETSKNKYEEAKKILAEATINFRSTITNSIDKITNTLEEEGKKMTKRIEDLQKIGVSEYYAKKYIADTECEASKRLGPDRMIAFLVEANNFEVRPDDAFNIWKHIWKKSMSENQLLDIITDMKANGITDHFFAVYKESKGKKENYKKAATTLNNIKISPEELNKFYTIPDAISAKKLDRVLDEMMRQGISNNFYETYQIAIYIENPNYKRVFELLDIENITDASDMSHVYSLRGETNTIKEYIKKFIETYNPAENNKNLNYAIDAFKTEPNIDKVIKYISFLYSQGLDGLKDFRVLHEIVPEIKDIESIPKKDIATLEALGIDKVSAIILAKEKIKNSISFKGEPENFVRALYKPEMKDKELAILYLLSAGDIDDAKKLILKSKESNDPLDPIKNILEGGNNATLFITILDKTNLTTSTILHIWSTTEEFPQLAISQALGIRNLINNLPRLRDSLLSEDGISYLNNVAGQYARFKGPEIKKFIEDLFSRHLETPVSNLATFLSDPSLPLSIEVSKVLGTDDREMALQIGRSLYSQGITSLPDKKTLALKIKEWEALQAAIDKEKLWEGTNVITVANNEKNILGQRRFDILVDKLNKSIGPNGTISSFTPSENPTSTELIELKRDILNKIATTPPPMRFFFNGHGGPNKLYLTNGEIKNGKIYEGNWQDANNISSEELAEATAKRRLNFPNKLDLIEKDTYIFSSCYNNEFMRKFYESIEEQEGIAPRAIGESEYGQYAFSPTITLGLIKSENEKLYRFGETGTTFGDIRKNQHKFRHSNITIYAPNKKGQPQQIGKAKTNKENKNS